MIIEIVNKRNQLIYSLDISTASYANAIAIKNEAEFKLKPFLKNNKLKFIVVD